MFAFLTTKPNDLVASVHPTRMPVMLVGEDAQSAWLDGSPDVARDLLQPYPAGEMAIVQRDTERADLVA